MSVEARLANIEAMLAQLLAAQGEPVPPPYIPDGDSPEAVIARCKAHGIDLRSHMRSVSEAAKARDRKLRKEGKAPCRP